MQPTTSNQQGPSPADPATAVARTAQDGPANLLLPLAACLVASGLACASLWLATLSPYWFPLSQQGRLCLWAPLVALGTTGLASGLLRLPRVTLSGLLQGLFVLLAVAAVANCDRTLADLRGYGDQGQLGAVLEARMSTSDLTAPDTLVRQLNTRWLLGSALLRRAYRAWLPLASAGPGMLLKGTPFVRATGAILMALASVLLLRRHGGRLAVLLPLLTPVWLLFSTGYDEYYPFIAWLFMALLLWLDSGLAERPAVLAGLFGGTLALAYVGYVPLALLLLAAFWARAGTRRGLLALAIALLLVWGGIRLFWPTAEAPVYSQQLLRVDLSLGEDNVSHPPYAGQSAAPWLPFFRPAYALSPQHLADLAGMLVLGTGPVCLALLAWRFRGCRFLARREYRFLGLLLVLQVLYFLAMIPKFGPVGDVDLFFTVYLSAAWLAGLLADRWLETQAPARQGAWRHGLALAQLSSSVVILAYLLLARG